MLFEIACIVMGVCAMAVLGQLLVLRIKGFGLRNAVGFFHPASGGGGGGERVLWIAILALQKHDISKGIQRKYVLYTKAYPAPQDTKKPASPSVTANLLGLKDSPNDVQINLLERVKTQFGIEIPVPLDVKVISEPSFNMLDGAMYPRFTLFLQTILGGFFMFYEIALMNNCCGVMIDSVGVPFLYPLLRIFCGATVITYTHYPSISSDMMGRVEGSSLKITVRLWYYRAFAVLYWICGQFVSATMCNSNWTRNHIRAMWGRGRERHLVYPPCNVSLHLSNNEAYTGTANPKRSDSLIVSVAQFRPEKNHSLQLRAFAKFIAMSGAPKGVKLVVAGGARNAEDFERVAALKKEAASLGLVEGTTVEFAVSIPYSRIVELLSSATVGLHTMMDEHFGIAVVEYLAAGAIPLAHNSAGPKMDIVTSDDIGRLATTEDEFAGKLFELFGTSREQRDLMRAAGAKQAQKFTDETFGIEFVKILEPFL